MTLTPDRRVDAQIKFYATSDAPDLGKLEASSRKLLADNLVKNRLPQALSAIAGAANHSRHAGLVAVAQGDLTGWKSVERYCRIREACSPRSGIKAAALAQALASPLLFLEWLDGAAFNGTTTAVELFFTEHPEEGQQGCELAMFASWCHRRIQGVPSPLEPLSGPLRELTLASALPDLPSGLLESVCEFQLSNFGLREEDGTQFVLFSILPLWWYALARARSAKNLPTPRPDHALFSTALAELPDKPTGYRLEDDELFPVISDLQRQLAPND